MTEIIDLLVSTSGRFASVAAGKERFRKAMFESYVRARIHSTERSRGENRGLFMSLKRGAGSGSGQHRARLATGMAFC